MSDNVTTQSTTPATPPASTVIATVEATHSGDTVQAGVGVLAKSSGAEGSRVLTIINPATEDKQDTANTSLSSIDGKLPALVSSRVPVDGSGVTQPVSAASLPLPSGAATSAKQDTGNTSLGNVDTAIGAKADGAATDSTSSWSVIALLKGLWARLTTINATLGSPFQAGGSIGNTAFGATQSGTWTVQPGNTANTTAWLVKNGPPAVAHDYVSLAQASTTDTYTRKSGGSGGTTVQTVTVTFTDSTKTVISNVAWT